MLAQYGAIGVIAILALAAVRVLFQRVVQEHKDEKDRADRLEAELKKLNETIQQQYLTVLAQATAAMSEAFDVIKAADGTKRDKRRR
jgi:Skp family chaperone for outer membrane proteins